MHHDLTISTPGRICLFGEHQDYLGLPVIPAAISLRMTVRGRKRTDSNVHVVLPDVKSVETFSLDDTRSYTRPNDYFRSAINVLRRNHFTFSRGFDCVVESKIPMQAGTSSSSALVVGWVNFLALASDQQVQLSAELLAQYAYQAEVLEFNEAGGMMDQYSVAYGGAVVIDFTPQLHVTRLDFRPGDFVLGDSGEPKDTQAILSRVKKGVIELVRKLSARHKSFVLKTATAEGLDRYRDDLTAEEFQLLAGTVRNHEITGLARTQLMMPLLDRRKFGALLSEHHAILRDAQRISTPKIERMLEAAMNAGAYGGKINGSGGGGCMFVYAPEDGGRIAEAIERAGGRAYTVSIDEGSKVVSHV